MLSQVRGSSRERSGVEPSLLGEFVDGGLVGAGGVVQLGFSWWSEPKPPKQHQPACPSGWGEARLGSLAAMELALQIILVVTSILVVLLVLLHRAKGGGLSTLFGGGVQSSLSGSTVVEKNLDRLTLFVTGIWVVSIIGMALQIKYA